MQKERDDAEKNDCVGVHIPKIVIANHTLFTHQSKHASMLHRIGEIERSLAKFAVAGAKEKEKEKDNKDCYAAFVTFHKTSDRDSCIRMFDDSLSARLSRGRRSQEEKDKLVFKCEGGASRNLCGKSVAGPISIKPRIRAAPAPSNIMWNNLEFSAANCFVRRFLVGIITAFMILISFSAIYSASVQASRAKDHNCVERIKAPSCASFLLGCNTSFVKLMAPETRSSCYLSMSKSFGNSTDNTCKACWCIKAISTLESVEDLLSDELIVKPDYRAMCSKSVEEFIVLQSLMRLSVAFISLVNIILKVCPALCVFNSFSFYIRIVFVQSLQIT